MSESTQSHERQCASAAAAAATRANARHCPASTRYRSPPLSIPTDAVAAAKQPPPKKNAAIPAESDKPTDRLAKKTTSGLKHAPQKGASLFRRGNRRVGIGNHLVNARRCRATPAAVSRTRATHLFFAAHAFLHNKANRQAYAYNQDRQHNSCCHIHNHNGLVSTGRVFAPYFHSPGTLPLFAVFLLLIEKCFPRVTYLTFFGVEGLSVNEIVKK